MIHIINVTILLLLMAGFAIASPINNTDAVKAIIGEAEGEPYQGKVALAYALINRGTLKGVYGHNAVIQSKDGRLYRKNGRLISEKVQRDALKAWHYAKANPSKDITLGADHWEGTAFKKPYWANGMTETITIGNQRFYK